MDNKLKNRMAICQAGRAAGIGGRMFSREKFIKERNEALFSLDEKKIKRYLKKYGITIPRNEEVFWRGIYKAVCNVEGAP